MCYRRFANESLTLQIHDLKDNQLRRQSFGVLSEYFMTVRHFCLVVFFTLITASSQLLAISHAQENLSFEVPLSAGSKSITLNNGTQDEFSKLVFTGDVRRIYLRNCDIDDTSLKRLEELKELQYLSLEGAKINGDGLVVLKSLPALKFLSLSGTKINDESLEHLISLKKLTILQLDDTLVTDRGIAKLTTLSRLEWLYLNRTKVTDTSMPCLGKLRELRFLSLLGTSVTNSGVDELHGVVPSVRVRH
jgi:Leucine-rich repeat (LRR) protein